MKPQNMYLVSELINDTHTTKVKKFRFTVGHWNEDRAVSVYPYNEQCYGWLLFDSIESADNYYKEVSSKMTLKKVG